MDLIQNWQYSYLFSNRDFFAIFLAWLLHETVI